MEKILMGIGVLFLYVASLIREAKNAVDSYLFDLLYEDDHSTK